MASPSKVERVLEQQGRSIAWLARKAGVSVAYAWRMLRGERPLTAEFRAAAAEALGVPEDLLFPVEPEKAAS
ncbi:MAG: helix-turn-helix transcriptional regulator [Chloroflexota bacterium]